MNKKIALTVFASICITLLLTQFNAHVVAVPRKPLALHDLIFVEGKSASDVDNPEGSIAKVARNTVILNQTFDDEQVGDIPENWNITTPQHGSFTVDNQTCYSGGKSAKFVDNSTSGSPCPYRTFPPQNGTVAVTFAIRLNASSGINTNLSIWVDDGNFAGSNIYFTNKSTIEYRDDDGFYILCNYTAKEWYEIKMIMNIPNNLYEIYINDIRIIRNATFYNFNVSREIRRIAFGEASGLQPIGRIDNIVIMGIKNILVPEDYPTIQDAIDMASPGITIRVASSDRSYYEHIRIRNKHDLRLKGENRSTTIIDGTFEGAGMDVISIDQYSYNVTISGFTIRKGGRSGISISGSNNTIKDNNITLNGYGIHVEGQHSAITDDIISNNKIGVNCTADGGNTFHHNRFICNEYQAFDYGSSNTWDNGTQGNYWSDYDGRDDDRDGIGDTPYFIPSGSQDNYPLFLIQKVSLNPDEPSYDQKVTITATTLEDVQVDEAILNFTYGSGWHNTTMDILDNTLDATIDPQPHGTTVTCKIHVRNVCAVCLVSANFSYTVTDKVPPEISDVKRTPKAPYPNQTVTIIANVSEPEKASGLDEVLLYHSIDDSSWWSANMAYDATSGQWNATIPEHPAGAEVTYYVQAFDKAGNNATSDPPDSYSVKPLPPPPEPPKLCVEKDTLDFKTMSEGTKALKFKIENCGGGTLTWEITIKRGGSWLNANSTSGNTTTTETDTIEVTINATHMDAGPYRGELSVTSNGGNETVHVFVLVTRIIIDNALVSDDRCDVNSTQTIYFHAIWANNYSAVQNGMLNITCIDYTTNTTDWAIHMTNATGWVSFTNSSLTVGKRAWMVTCANCSGITSYAQEAPNPNILWEQEQAPFWTQWAFFMMIVVVAAIGGGIFSTLAFWTLRVSKRRVEVRKKIRMH